MEREFHLIQRTNQETNKDLKILVFSWNTESVNICESLYDEVINQRRSSWFNKFNPLGWNDCYKADFISSLIELIQQENVDIVVFGTQEDVANQGINYYFKDYLLPEQMGKINYVKIVDNYLTGVGVTTVKKRTLRGLSTVVFVKASLARDIINNDRANYNCGSIFLRNKGASAVYLQLPGISTLAFINVHLPFVSSTIVDYNPGRRQEYLKNEVNPCLRQIIKELVIENQLNPQHVILFGDLNYRLYHPDFGPDELAEIIRQNNNTKLLKKIYLHFDELKELLDEKSLLLDFQEGVDNNGPLFPPTCKMTKGRDRPLTWNTKGKRYPSWCDRILYYSSMLDSALLICYLYDRFDVGETMKLSDHSAVLGLFRLCTEACW